MCCALLWKFCHKFQVLWGTLMAKKHLLLKIAQVMSVLNRKQQFTMWLSLSKLDWNIVIVDCDWDKWFEAFVSDNKINFLHQNPTRLSASKLISLTAKHCTTAWGSRKAYLVTVVFHCAINLNLILFKALAIVNCINYVNQARVSNPQTNSWLNIEGKQNGVGARNQSFT